jgi:hypothetical protein
MKFRRTADHVRAAGWVNLAATALISMFNAFDGGMEAFAVGSAWAAAVMLVAYSSAWAIDRHADRVVGRCVSAPDAPGARATRAEEARYTGRARRAASITPPRSVLIPRSK